MNYSVRWDDIATENILQVAEMSHDAGGTIAAVGEINQRLTAHPKSAGATTHEVLWTITVRRLRVMYEIDDGSDGRGTSTATGLSRLVESP